MHTEEENELVECLDCGAEVSPEIDYVFPLGDDAFLCGACAIRRGGVFDPDIERWTVPPDVSDEPDERRPHA